MAFGIIVDDPTGFPDFKTKPEVARIRAYLSQQRFSKVFLQELRLDLWTADHLGCAFRIAGWLPGVQSRAAIACGTRVAGALCPFDRL